jgi:hypothetical protein
LENEKWKNARAISKYSRAHIPVLQGKVGVEGRADPRAAIVF